MPTAGVRDGEGIRRDEEAEGECSERAQRMLTVVAIVRELGLTAWPRLVRTISRSRMIVKNKKDPTQVPFAMKVRASFDACTDLTPAGCS